MKIAVIHDYANVFRATKAFDRLREHEVLIHTDPSTHVDRLIGQIEGCEAVLLTQQRVPLTRHMLERLPSLQFVCQTGRNVYHIDIGACTDAGVVVSAGGAGDSDSPYPTTGELTWALILSSRRHIPFEAQRLNGGHWQSTVGMQLAGATLGVYGLGHIGLAVARVGRAFGMKVVCLGRERSEARARAEGFEMAPNRETFFSESDVVSLHLPGGAATHGLVTSGDLARMKPTALLVNTSRASIIEEGALVHALTAGRPGFAAVDVFAREPVVGADHPLLRMKNVLCTPHLGYAERLVYEKMYGFAAEYILAYASGRPINVVNPEAATRRHSPYSAGR